MRNLIVLVVLHIFGTEAHNIMSQCVPAWDHVSGGESDQIGSLAPNMYCVSKSKSSDQEHGDRNGLTDQLPAAVPDYEVAELTWVNGQPYMQGLGSKGPNRHHHHHHHHQRPGCGAHGLPCHWPNESAVTRAARSQGNDKEVDGTLDAIVARSMDVPVANLPLLDDEMVSWFQYPLYNDNFNGQEGSNMQQQHPRKADKSICNNTAARSSETNPDALVPSNIMRPEAFVNTSIPANPTPYPSTSGQQTGTDGSINFSHFSRPAVMMKANLHTLGTASGPTNIQRVRQHSGPMDVSSDAMPVSIVGSTSGLCTNSFASEEADRPQASTEAGANTLLSKNQAAGINNLARKGSRPLPSAPSSNDCITKALEESQNFSMSGSATIGRERTNSETYDAMGITFASTSGGSPTNSATEKRGKEPCRNSTRWKRKSRGEEDSGCQSEDVDDESAEPKKPQVGRSNSGKRSRAAAVHNQSERRRRDRINEKMKALQKLIPNSSKTDKASMLDEAIEYLKHLQAQLQMMSLRNGLSNIPPMVMPLGMQQLQMSLLASLGPMGIGMGMAGVGLGMGMGMGMMDMNPVGRAAAIVTMPQPIPATTAPALPGSVHSHATFIPPNLAAAFSAPSDANERLQNAALLDPYTAFMACQRQSMNINMDLYNTMAMQHQQQQQQQQQQQFLQQQQQQHQLLQRQQAKK
eukprot:Gb_30387 [translate_table: standard]